MASVRKSRVQQLEDILLSVYDALEEDCYGKWLPEWCLHSHEEGTEFSYEQFIKNLGDIARDRSKR